MEILTEQIFSTEHACQQDRNLSQGKKNTSQLSLQTKQTSVALRQGT